MSTPRTASAVRGTGADIGARTGADRAGITHGATLGTTEAIGEDGMTRGHIGATGAGTTHGTTADTGVGMTHGTTEDTGGHTTVIITDGMADSDTTPDISTEDPDTDMEAILIKTAGTDLDTRLSQTRGCLQAIRRLH